MKASFILSFLVLFNSFSFSQEEQKEFIEALINNSENLEKYVDKEELAKSTRLGINYDSVKYKFMISYGIDEKVKEEIKKNNIKYEVKTSVLDKEYSLAEFTVHSLNYTKQFYFKNGKWISPVTYFSKDWTTKASRYFIFKISEPKYFNDYCINKLDECVDSVAALLEFDEQQKQLLEKEKIYYVLCKDEKEIEMVTGFNTRGIYITAFDEVVTTYNTHYHELAHLLMNYKLKNLSLYTLPFFMEGFAVAIGGRGGMAKRVVLDIGYYLQKSGFLTYDSLITNDGFYKEDASMTYPVAGLYNAFLLKEIGTERYIGLYNSVKGDLARVRKISVNDLNLPNAEKFNNYLAEYEVNPTVYLNANDTNNKPKIVLENGQELNIRELCGTFMKIGNYYKFFISCSPFLFSTEDSDLYLNYISKKYKDILDDEEETGENPPEYGIVCDSFSINLYNFYTNETIASFSTNFSINHTIVPSHKEEEEYSFFIIGDVFESNLDSTYMIIGKVR